MTRAAETVKLEESALDGQRACRERCRSLPNCDRKIRFSAARRRDRSVDHRNCCFFITASRLPCVIAPSAVPHALFGCPRRRQTRDFRVTHAVCARAFCVPSEPAVLSYAHGPRNRKIAPRRPSPPPAKLKTTRDPPLPLYGVERVSPWGLKRKARRSSKRSTSPVRSFEGKRRKSRRSDAGRRRCV